jgi:hypothetical protein
MKLTRRQETFVQKMIELKQEFNGPVRYALLAERLGVSPFTAYDMLCLLEEKGYVTSQYQLPTDKAGPGRAERVFYPAGKALAHQQHIFAETGGQQLEGEALKAFVLEKFRKGEFQHDESELAEQMMARMLIGGQGDVRYCVEVMTVAALRLQHSTGRQVLFAHLPEILPGAAEACNANLALLGGFVFGLLAQQNAPGLEWLSQLRQHLQGYLDVVMGMDGEACSQLAAQLANVFTALGGAE